MSDGAHTADVETRAGTAHPDVKPNCLVLADTCVADEFQPVGERTGTDNLHCGRIDDIENDTPQNGETRKKTCGDPTARVPFQPWPWSGFFRKVRLPQTRLKLRLLPLTGSYYRL